jgi:hypothetical protein
VPAPVEEFEPNDGGCGGSGTNKPQPGYLFHCFMTGAWRGSV